MLDHVTITTEETPPTILNVLVFIFIFLMFNSLTYIMYSFTPSKIKEES
jgi:hypothetical protein